MKKCATAKFDETVEMSVRLGVDPKQADQMVRGVVNLPNGTGRVLRVAVFARGPKADEAKAAGADVVGAEDLVNTVMGGAIDFDRCIATPDMMPLVGRLGKVLGPRGMMPNPKVGTVTMDVAKTVTATFNKLVFALSVTKAGTGTGVVTSSPAGINCGATCTYGYQIGTAVTLTATVGPAGATGTVAFSDGSMALGTCATPIR